MMGVQSAPERLFYDFCLENHVPDGPSWHISVVDPLKPTESRARTNLNHL